MSWSERLGYVDRTRVWTNRHTPVTVPGTGRGGFGLGRMGRGRRRVRRPDARFAWRLEPALTELLLRELAEALARLVVRAHRLVAGISRISRNLFCDRAHLGGDRGGVLGVA